ncbi:SPL family radical SAM protein [Mycoplasma sp. P36-A1]|uniref:SPL family radical SAM protein n=1 Tax=Mycoplasma sp. P36-A1 TaxID=3252900 RepID=UPI003C2F45BA
MIEYIEAKSILQKSKNGSGWFGIDYTINMYRGCNYGCIYCDSRSEIYNITNFDKVKVKKDALIILEKELKSKRNKGIVSLGAMSDSYNKLEESLLLSQNTIKLLTKYGFGLNLETKSSLILRDIDLIAKMNETNDVIIKVTITTANDQKAKLIEPNVSSSSERFEIIKQLSAKNIYCGILMMPLIPGFNDTFENIKEIVEKAAASNAKFIYPAFAVTIRKGQVEYFDQQLKIIDPRLHQELGLLNKRQYVIPSKQAKQLYKYFEKLCIEYNIKYKMKDIIKEYIKPKNEQLSFNFTENYF